MRPYERAEPYALTLLNEIGDSVSGEAPERSDNIIVVMSPGGERLVRMRPYQDFAATLFASNR